MYILPLAFLLSFGFGQSFKWSQRRGCNAPIVLPTNYLVLGTALALYYGLQGRLLLTHPILTVGVLTGCAFIFSMLIMTRALEIANVATVLTAFRLSILVPVGASVWLWDETITGLQLAGIALAVVALILMTRGKSTHSGLSNLRNLALISLVFMSQGLSHCGMRWIHYAGLDDQRQLVLLVIALTAGSLGAVFVLILRLRPRPDDLRMGAGIGLFNMFALLVTLTALSLVPGTVYFPLQGCTVVILDNLFAHFFWKEPLSPRAAVGAGLGAISMLLVL